MKKVAILIHFVYISQFKVKQVDSSFFDGAQGLDGGLSRWLLVVHPTALHPTKDRTAALGLWLDQTARGELVAGGLLEFGLVDLATLLQFDLFDVEKVA